MSSMKLPLWQCCALQSYTAHIGLMSASRSRDATVLGVSACKHTGSPEEPFASRVFASSTMVLKWSSSNQHSFVVRHSSCTSEVVTYCSSWAPRLQRAYDVSITMMFHIRIGASL